jgi:hypothetical protein
MGSCGLQGRGNYIWYQNFLQIASYPVIITATVVHGFSCQTHCFHGGVFRVLELAGSV